MTHIFSRMLVLVIVFASATILQAKTKLQPMSLKQVIETKSVSSSRLSPNGEHIAYTLRVPRETYVEKDGSAYSELYVSTKSGESRRFITGKVTVSSISWGPKNQYIYYRSKRNDDKFTSLYRIAVNGGESERLFESKVNVGSYSVSADAKTLVYLSKPASDKSDKKLKDKGFKAKVYEESAQLTRAYKIDLMDLSKKAEAVEIEGHLLSAKFHPSKNELLLRIAPTALIDDDYTASQYRIHDLSGELKQSFKTEGKLDKASWSTDGKYVAIIGAENKNDPATGRLYLANTKSGKIEELIKDYQGHVRDIAWESDYRLTYLGHIGTKSEVSTINLDNQSITAKIPQSDVVLTGIETDASGKTMIGLGSTDKHPREVFELTSGKPERLTNSNSWLTNVIMPKQETITYKARDGVEIQGVLIYPHKYKRSKRYPLIMMVHGGPEAHVSDAWLDRYSYPIKHAAANGYAVFLPNYRGSTGRGVEFSKMGQADYAGAEFNDLVDAITHLSEKGVVDKKRVGITGGSYGGYASAWAATALSEHFAASVMFVGISNQLSKFGTTDIPKEMYDVHARNYPWDKWQWMLERSPIYHTDKAKTPILIMHGDKDTRVHPSQSMELYRYIKTRTDTPVRLVFYPGEPHGNRKMAAQLDYSMRLMRWMDYYLKGKNKAKSMPAYDLKHDEVLDAIAKEKK